MKKHALITGILMGAWLCMSAPTTASSIQLASDVSEKIKISAAADIPTELFTLNTLPSDFVFGTSKSPTAAISFLESYIARVENGYYFSDLGAQREFLGLKRTVALATKQWQEVINLSQQIRSLEEKPAAREISSLLQEVYARTALITDEANRDAFASEYQKQLAQAFASVDVALAKDELQAILGRQKLLTENYLRGYITSYLDVQAKQTDMHVPAAFVGNLLSLHRTRNRLLPLNKQLVTGLSETLARVSDVKTENLWDKRAIVVDEGESILVAVWDTGIDAALHPDKMWVNPDKQALNAHGLAYTADFKKQRENLTKRVAPFADEIADLQYLLKGFFDQRNNKSTEASAHFQGHFASLTPEQMADLQWKLGEIATYAHGQMVSDVASFDMRQMELMNITMTWPTFGSLREQPIDEEYIDKLVAAATETVKFMQQHKVRVANLSWRFSLPMIEQGLLLSGLEKTPQSAKARAKKMFKTLNDGLTKAFASAPEILFVAGAGNEDENVEFVQSTPAGINLPNFITIGAVDQELQPTSFTSFGSSIDFYANGFDVDVRMPGGLEGQAEGTSISAPLVSNLAAKMLSLQPNLTPRKIVSMMREYATLEGEQKLPVIHPSATICALSPVTSGCSKNVIASVK